MEMSIGFDGLAIHCIIGELPHERIVEQQIFVDLRITTDAAKAALSDDIKDTVDYTELARLATRLAQDNSYKLLEAYAAALLRSIILVPGVLTAWVRIEKPGSIPKAKAAVVEASL